MQIMKRPSIADKGAKDIFAVGTLPEFAAIADSVPNDNDSRKQCRSNASWFGCKSYDTSVEQVRKGDLSGVPASDALMTKIENDIPATRAWRVRHDVVGGIPNVPAYLAGHPYNMHRRERQAVEQGPISIYASLELSAAIDVATMRQRGASILALVRLLSNQRPVELFACCSVGERGFGVHIITKLDTLPLDLARVAHFLTCPSVTRGLNYAVGHELAKQIGKKWDGNWAYGNCNLYRKHAREIYRSVTTPTADTLLIPAAHLNDPAVKEPTKWLHDMLKKYGGMEQEGD